MTLSIALCYDSKEEYLAAGHSHLEVMEFDDEGVIAGLEQALARLGHRVERVGRGRNLAGRLAAGERWDLVFNIAEGLSGRGPRGPGAGAVRALRSALHLLRPGDLRRHPRQGARQADRARRRAADSRVRRRPDSGRRPAGRARPARCSSSRSPRAAPRGSRDARSSSAAEGLAARCAAPARRLSRRPAGRALPAGPRGHRRRGRQRPRGPGGGGDGGGVDRAGRGRRPTPRSTRTSTSTAIAYRLVEGEPLAAEAAAARAGRVPGARVPRRRPDRPAGRTTPAGSPSSRSTRCPGLHPVRSDLPIMARLAGIAYDDLLAGHRRRRAARNGLCVARRVVVVHNAVGDDDDPSTRDVLAQVAWVATGLVALGIDHWVAAGRRTIGSPSHPPTPGRWSSTWSSRHPGRRASRSTAAAVSSGSACRSPAQAPTPSS